MPKHHGKHMSSFFRSRIGSAQEAVLARLAERTEQLIEACARILQLNHATASSDVLEAYPKTVATFQSAMKLRQQVLQAETKLATFRDFYVEAKEVEENWAESVGVDPSVVEAFLERSFHQLEFMTFEGKVKPDLLERLTGYRWDFNEYGEPIRGEKVIHPEIPEQEERDKVVANAPAVEAAPSAAEASPAAEIVDASAPAVGVSEAIITAPSSVGMNASTTISVPHTMTLKASTTLTPPAHFMPETIVKPPASRPSMPSVRML